MDFILPEEYLELKRRVRKFVDEECLPLEKEVERLDDVPDTMFNKLKAKSIEIGLYAPFAPIEYGGGGVSSYLAEMLFWEEMGRTCLVFSDFLVGNSGRDLNNASEYQKEKFFIPTIKGEKIGGFGAMAEPGGTSDMSNYQTKAVRKGENWVINGHKWLITSANRADWGRVWAITDEETKRLDIFLIEKGTPGLKIVRRQPFMGFRGAHHCDLYFTDCVVPESHRMITKPGNPGADHRMRLRRAAQGLGAAQRCFDLGTEYSKKRVTFGKPLATRQDIQFSLARSAMEMQSARLMIWYSAWKADQGKDIDVEEAMCKILCTELAQRIADRVMLIYGGLGYTEDLPIARIFRDQQGARIWSTANPVLMIYVAKSILGKELVKFR